MPDDLLYERFWVQRLHGLSFQSAVVEVELLELIC